MAVIIGSWLMFSNNLLQTSVEENNTFSEMLKKEVTLVIDDGRGNPKTFITEIKEGITAFDLLEEGAKKLDLALKTKKYSIGIFVEAIGDRKNGQDGKYWLYYINGQPPMVAADKKEVKAGDKVEFKFGKSPF